MFARLFELSRILRTGEPWEMLNEGLPETYDRGMAVCFDKNARFAGVKAWRRRDVIYRSGPTNGTDFTPCCKLSGSLTNPENPEARYKTPTRLGRAVASLAESASDPDLRDWLTAVSDSWKDNLEEITDSCTKLAHAEVIDKQHRAYMFLARLDGQRIDPVFNLPDAKKHLVHQFLEGLEKKAAPEMGTCFLCGESGRTVFGNFSLLKCYSLDKRGTIAGGFDTEGRPARNFPVCDECAVPVASSIVFALEKLTAKNNGLSYMILPSATTAQARRWLLDGVKNNPQRFSLNRSRDILAMEQDLLDELANVAEEGVKDHLSFSLVFFRESNAEWRIQAEVQQVLLSRVREIWRAVDDIAADPLLERKVKTGKKSKGGHDAQERKPLRVNTWVLKQFTADDLSIKQSEKLLQQWLAALFEHRTIDRRPFIHQLVRSLLATWRREASWGITATLRSWAVLRFALLTDLVEGEENMDPEIPKSPHGRFCQEHPDFFTRQESVTAFLMGCYCHIVESVQYRERGARPFGKKYHGRMLRGRELRRLYREARDKLAQYGAIGIVANRLDSDVAESFVACGGEWDLNEDETTFAFNLGLALQYRISDKYGATEDKIPPPEEVAEASQ